ncbi:MAG: hypothetical protein ACE5QV_08810, partial [Fidelibacterota bacterium]
RRMPGLFNYLNRTIPMLVRKYRNNDIILNTAITRYNYKYLLELAGLAREWGVGISYSAYSILRTGDRKHFISSDEHQNALLKMLHSLIKFKAKNGVIINPDHTLINTYWFFKRGYIPHCRAGVRFLVVRPDGTLNACSMYPSEIYNTQKEMRKNFSIRKGCGECYVSIRAYSDRTLVGLVKSGLNSLKSVNRSSS